MTITTQEKLAIISQVLELFARLKDCGAISQWEYDKAVNEMGIIKDSLK